MTSPESNQMTLELPTQQKRYEKGEVASLAGFEPATRCLEGSRSVQLSYRDI